MNQIILHEMSKSFGKKNVIKAQNACFSPGQIYGIVGQNGCGKTVLFKCMSGLMPTTSGRIEIQLDDPAQKARPYCGVVIDGAGFNDSLSGLSNLVALADITKKADKKAIASLMTSVGLSPDNRKKVRYYSLGMRQRLAIAQAIMEDPAILLLDEPLNGLDYEGVKTVYDILKVQKERGKIILVASHHEDTRSVPSTASTVWVHTASSCGTSAGLSLPLVQSVTEEATGSSTCASCRAYSPPPRTTTGFFR